MKLPRVECPSCTRRIAAGMVAGRLSKGRIWRHDAPDARRDAQGHLLSCAGSLEIVDLPYGQMEIPAVEPEPEPEPDAAAADAMALF
ncbi:hypothetical protein VSR01_17185 [Actinacidiphila sp. DG2A-62]|uniref:hypothetical protein n=1 Tax=Actinacidiphila sp. DG2A-62 TaxID=3108821 RepID=UPI002DB7CFDA|nr:hypothetical protein [Actinacidiphila sp. DG2A-62]MEC3995173.1 hypothetical protein [Actinacidiphila sp. DG2A-62]